MKARLILTTVSIAIISCASIAQPSSLEDLQTRCAKKTLVYGRDGVRIGETLDGYCAGFLEGSFALMERAKLICPEKRSDGAFLLSVLTAYVNDKKLKAIDAGEAVEAAYRRAFPCKQD